MIKRISLLLFLVTGPGFANAQFRPATCEVKPLWIGREVRSSNFGLMGRFEKNRNEGMIVRSFKLENTPIVATVGISFVSDYSQKKDKAYDVKLAIVVSEKDGKDIFESVDSSEARTRYRKGWNLSVTKNVPFKDLVYVFTLRCWDTAAFVGKKPWP